MTQMRALIAVALFVLGVLIGSALATRMGNERLYHARVEQERVLRGIADKAAKARDALTQYRTAVSADFLNAETRHARELADAAHAAAAAADALRRDPARLRAEWRCPAGPAAGVVQAPAAAIGPADAADLRASGVGRVFGLAAAADADIGRCQALIRAIYRLPPQ